MRSTEINEFSNHIKENQALQLVAEAAQDLQLETYVVGGYVRDLILNRPSKDIDFVCVGSGIQLAEEVGKRCNRKVSVFKSFGTAAIRWEDYELEFVGARKESYRSNSRNPIVEDGTLEEDQDRRDFTINAMAIGLNPGDFGKLLDPFDGMGDLERKMIKTPTDPQRTFSEDPLRMIRAIRFATQLEFDIDPDTFQSILDNKQRLKIITQERITDELNKIILSKVPSYGFKLLFHAGLLELFFPEMVELHGVDKIKGKTHKDNFYHTLQVLDNICEFTDDLWLRWAAIMHDIAKPRTKRFVEGHGFTFHGHEDKGARMTPGIFKKLKLPMGPPMKYVQKLVKLHLRPIALVKDTITDAALRRLLFEAGDDIDDLMKLCRADITSKNDRKVQKYIKNFEKVEKKLIEVEEKDQVRNFQPPISGEEIMKYFQIKPSKTVGVIKDEIKESIMEGRIPNKREEAWNLMIELGEKLGLKKQA